MFMYLQDPRGGGQCSECGERFPDRSTLTNHLLTQPCGRSRGPISPSGAATHRRLNPMTSPTSSRSDSSVTPQPIVITPEVALLDDVVNSEMTSSAHAPEAIYMDCHDDVLSHTSDEVSHCSDDVLTSYSSDSGLSDNEEEIDVESVWI